MLFRSEGKVIKLVQQSPFRTAPFCDHFGLCGGCKWQHMTYDGQVQFKEKQVRDAMERIAKIKSPNISPILKAPEINFYRNKMEYTFTNKRYLLNEEMNIEGPKELNGLGFHIPEKFNKVVDIHTCFLQDKRADQIRLFVREFAK